jgi:hypothetical protein
MSRFGTLIAMEINDLRIDAETVLATLRGA